MKFFSKSNMDEQALTEWKRYAQFWINFYVHTYIITWF